MSASIWELEPIGASNNSFFVSGSGAVPADTGGPPLSYTSLVHCAITTAATVPSTLLEPLAVDCQRIAVRMRELRQGANEIRQSITAVSALEKELSDKQEIVRQTVAALMRSVCEKPDIAGFTGNSEINVFSDTLNRALQELDIRTDRLRTHCDRECAALVEKHGRLVENLVALKAAVREGMMIEEDTVGVSAAANTELPNACVICGENPVDRVFVECVDAIVRCYHHQYTHTTRG